MLNIPPLAEQYGFTLHGLGTHASRTMMLAELRLLLAACPPTATFADYRHAIVEENVLLKQTASTRIESVRRLRELYGINPELLIFRALRELWEQDVETQSLLALFCALARDPVLRMTSRVILQTVTGDAVNAEMISRTVQEQYSEPLNPTSLANIGRHAASTWTQSGHLKGRTNKTRAWVQPTPIATAYALLLGYLAGERGEEIFHSLWAKILDTPAHHLPIDGRLEPHYAGQGQYLGNIPQRPGILWKTCFFKIAQRVQIAPCRSFNGIHSPSL